MNIRNWNRAGVMLVSNLAEQGGLQRRADAEGSQDGAGHRLGPLEVTEGARGGMEGERRSWW